MTDLRVPYATPIRSTKVDALTGAGYRFWEAQCNKAIAALAAGPNELLRRALVLAVFPQLDETDWPDGRVPHLEESGNGADFVAVDYSPAGARTELARTEHKPGRTPAQWNHAISTTDLLSCPAVEVTDEQTAHIRRYRHVLDKRWIDEHDFAEIGGYQCNGLKDHSDWPGVYESVWPQVIGYLMRPTPLPVVQVIADRTDDINALYNTEPVWYRLKPEYFPICTTAAVLNTLAREIDLDRLSRDEQVELTRVVDALWMSADWNINDLCDDAVRALVSDATWHIAHNWDEADWITWEDWTTRSNA